MSGQDGALPPYVPPGGDRCEATSGSFTCNAAPGHEPLDHAAYGPGGDFCHHRWPCAPESESEPQRPPGMGYVVGCLTDSAGTWLATGADADRVIVRIGEEAIAVLDQSQHEEFMRDQVRAGWLASANAERIRAVSDVL